MTTDIMIASAAQTPVGSFNGAFATSPRTTLVPVAIKAALNRAKVAAEEVDEVILGQSPHLDAWQGPTNRHGP
jgi:acetyl-CoA C-acetyltransferase